MNGLDAMHHCLQVALKFDEYRLGESPSFRDAPPRTDGIVMLAT
jgi:hypothetical protein